MANLFPDEVEVKSMFLAAYLSYQNYPVMKCSVDHRNKATWTYLIPSCDMELLIAEFKDENNGVSCPLFVNAFQTVMDIQATARRSGGEWTSEEWREMVRRRN